jgi:hypothetical protein
MFSQFGKVVIQYLEMDFPISDITHRKTKNYKQETHQTLFENAQNGRDTNQKHETTKNELQTNKGAF